MPTIFIRTVIFYVLIIISMRLTGKRQVGQLELSELVTAFMLSELASIPIADTNIPLLHGVVPILTLISLEVFVSFFCVKSTIFRRLIDGTSSTLMQKGKINKKALLDSRISITELLSAMRSNGIGSIEEVDYIFLEPSGTISIIQKKKNAPLTPEIINKNCDQSSVSHSVVIDGKICNEGLYAAGQSKHWLFKQLNQKKLSLKDIYYCAVDDSGKLTIITNKETQH